MDYNSKKIALVIVAFLFFCGALILFRISYTKNNPTPAIISKINPNDLITTPIKVITPTSTPSTTTTEVEPKNIESNKTSNTTSDGLPSQSTSKLLKNMRLTFNDEFNNFSRYVDPEGNVTCNSGGNGTWQTVYGFCSRTISTNYESEVYIDPSFLSYFNSTHSTPTQTPSPFSVNNGILNIEAAPIDPAVLAAVGAWAKYTSGLITTQFSFSQEYGYFEMRAKLPAGKGLWPAFWLLPVSKQWPPEIDAMEAFGDPNSKNEGGRTMVHYQSILTDQSKSCGGWHNVKTDLTQDFHSYGVDVEPNGITYYFDGQAYAQCPTNPETNQQFYMLIDLAVGSSQSWPTSPNASNSWPAILSVDYVRAYQNN